jgi:endonuclease/exonuclease/phosphatase family metal-dependent hydrolase
MVTLHHVTDMTEATISPITADLLGPEVSAGQGQHVRFVAASIVTPLGEVLAGSTHLKCCGFAGSEEDARRIAEAAAINNAYRTIAGATAPALRVIGGDMNLVGSRTPIDMLRASLDADGSDMDIAPALVLGDAAYYTWADDANNFSPGRLDWLLIGDAQARVVNAFALDTTRLSDAALSQAGLQRTDSRASDHMPVVVDLIRR